MTHNHPNDQVYALELTLATTAARGEDCKPDMNLIDSQAVGNG